MVVVNYAIIRGMNLDQVQQQFPSLITEARAESINSWADRVALHRNYAMGNQYVYLTQNQRRMLNIHQASYDSFNANYCMMVIRMMADRLTVAEFAADNALQEWVADWQERSDFDALQIDTHDAVLRDGDAFLLTAFNENGQSIPKLNYAYDGENGIIPIYNGTVLETAIKVRGDEVELWDPSMVIHFAHRRLPGRDYGVSEIADIISLQDVLNRIIASMVIAGELSAFQIRFAKGFEPPATIEPGSVVVADGDDIKLPHMDFRSMAQGSLVEYISEIDRVIVLIAEISQTPIASVMGTNPGVEALKQQESGLLGKVRAAQVKLGRAWELAVRKCAALDGQYALSAPDVVSLATRWEPLEVRGTLERIDIALRIFEQLRDPVLLVEMAGEALDWTREQQEAITERHAETETRRLQQLSAMTIPADFTPPEE